MPYRSFLKRNFGNDIFNQTFFIPTKIPTGLPHRASIRSTATQHVVKYDAVFDKNLGKADNGELLFESLVLSPWILPTYYLELEPRKPRDDGVDMFIDLEATRGDHEEVRNLTFRRPFRTC